MGPSRFGPIVAVLIAASPSASAAAEAAGIESWSFQKVNGTPVSAELPYGGTVVSRDFNNEYGAMTPGSSMWGRQLTLQSWPSGAWHDSIRLDYYVVEGRATGRLPQADEWSYGLSDHTARDADPQTPWAPPEIKKRQGYRYYETARDTTVLGEAIVTVEYNIELGPGRMVRLVLSCRKGSFKGYVPYYVRIRDTLALPKRKVK